MTQFDISPYYEQNKSNLLTYQKYYDQKEKERNDSIDKYINEFDLLSYKYV